jgi:hypothetical protein
MLAENLIDLKQSELMIDWCADVLDTGSLGTAESSMAKVAVSEALMRIADRCVQVMGGTGVSGDTIVEQAFREIRAFRIYDGPTEVHKWSLAKKIKRDWKPRRGSVRRARLFRRDERGDGRSSTTSIIVRSASMISDGRAIISSGRSRAGRQQYYDDADAGRERRAWNGRSNG